MREMCLKAMMLMQLKMMGLLEDFRNEEKGASEIVAIILIIVVIIAVAAIFKTQLIGAMNSVMAKLTEFIG